MDRIHESGKKMHSKVELIREYYDKVPANYAPNQAVKNNSSGVYESKPS